MSLCRHEKLALMPWGPLAGGMLTGKYTDEASLEGTRAGSGTNSTATVRGRLSSPAQPGDPPVRPRNLRPHRQDDGAGGAELGAARAGVTAPVIGVRTPSNSPGTSAQPARSWTRPTARPWTRPARSTPATRPSGSPPPPSAPASAPTARQRSTQAPTPGPPRPGAADRLKACTAGRARDEHGHGGGIRLARGTTGRSSPVMRGRRPCPTPSR